MAIDRMKKVTLLSPVASAQRLMKEVHRLGVVEVTDAFDERREFRDQLDRHQVSTEEIDRNLQKINLILALLDQFAPEQRGFIAGLAPVPLIIDSKELDDARQHFDLEGHYATAQELDAVYRRTERAISEINNQLRDLELYEDLPFMVADLAKPVWTRLVFGLIPVGGLADLAADAEASGALAWGTVVPGPYHRKNGSAGAPPASSGKRGEKTRVVFAFLKDQEEAARAVLAARGFEEVVLPQLSGYVRDHIRELKADLAQFEEQAREVAARAAELAVHRRSLLVLKAFWDGNKSLALARTNTAEGKWVNVATGYVRERDLPALEQTLRADFPGVSLLVEDPAPDEDVPVSLSLPPLVRPVQLLVNMYGLPRYSGFDPSPYLFFSFFLFFGFCFGDVAYGTMLIALSLYIMKRTRPYEGVYNFAKLLFFAGLPTLVFGFLLGSCFGDLYKAEYLGEGNPLQRVMQATTVLDPMEQPVVLLLAALGIGVLNQFFAIGLKMYGLIKQGDKWSAVCDGLFWLIALPGFIVLVSGMFMTPPAPLYYVGLALFLGGALGLVLTQGRESKNPIARLMTGLVSLYGIVGSYGITAFIGDTMSYCRLLALGLTTSIVAMSFNMIANLLRPVPYAGIFLFVGALLIGHIFNFFISVMGAFVHSMRLILVEFFGRFYEGGAKPFTPLGFDSEAAILRKSESRSA